jgi:hypothetical protein
MKITTRTTYINIDYVKNTKMLALPLGIFEQSCFSTIFYGSSSFYRKIFSPTFFDRTLFDRKISPNAILQNAILPKCHLTDFF